MQPPVPKMQPRGCIVKGYPAFFPVVTHPDSDYVLTTIERSQSAPFCTDLPLCPEICENQAAGRHSAKRPKMRQSAANQEGKFDDKDTVRLPRQYLPFHHV